MCVLSLYFVSFLVLQLPQFIWGGHNGFTIKLIHKDSIESPLFPGNLTYEERVARHHQQSKIYLERMTMSIATAAVEAAKTQANVANKTAGITPEGIQPPIAFEGTFYMAWVGIGTFDGQLNSMPFWLLVDSGSNLIWTQCEGCYPNCFDQVLPLYPFSKSRTYHPVSCSEHTFCGQKDHCLANICTYTVKYAGGGISDGFLAHETLSFASTNEQGIERFEGLVFGCGFYQKNFDFNQPNPKLRAITGVLGLGRGRESLVSQLGERAQGRFSHCLPPWRLGEVPDTALQFGVDAGFQEGQQVSTIPLYNHPFMPVFYLNLEDISVLGHRLRRTFPPEGSSFEVREDGRGGCFIDTGCPYTFIQVPQYAYVLLPLVQHFSTFEPVEHATFQSCYKKKNGFVNFPSITFHFDKADLEVGPNELFIDFGDHFCIAFLPTNTDGPSVIIGNRWMANYKFMYDLKALQVSFAREDCKKGM